jgi:hypothetical protein
MVLVIMHFNQCYNDNVSLSLYLSLSLMGSDSKLNILLIIRYPIEIWSYHSLISTPEVNGYL